MGTVRIGGIVKSSPSTQFWLEADWVAQEVGNNRSLLRVWLRAANGPSGTGSSQFNNYGIQEAYADGHGRVGWVEGNPFLPGGYAQNQTRWHVHVADRWYGHDANGYLGNIGLSMHLAYGNINEWHGGSIGAPARIPKPPGPPNPIGIDQVTTTSFRYQFSGTTDGGSPITGWFVEYANNPSFTGSTTIGSNGTSVISGLTPGTTYYVRSWGNNAHWTGVKSSVLSQTTLPATPPGMTIVPSLSGFNATVNLTPPGGVTGVTEYNVQYRPTATGTPTTSRTTTTTTLNVTGLTPGLTYDWRANAEIGAYTSPWTAWTPYVQPNPNTDPGNYFDGSTPDTSENTFSWNGATNNSTSDSVAPFPLGWWAFSTGAGGTGATGGVTRVLDSAPVASGQYAARATWHTDATASGWRGGATGVNVEGGSTYVGSIYVKPSRSQRLAARMEWFDGGGVDIPGGTTGTPVIVPANVWTRLTVTAVAPENAEIGAILVTDVTGSGWSVWLSGESLTMDAAMVSLSNLFDYFDGNTPDTLQFDYEWLGTTDNSQSRRLELAVSTLDLLADPDCPPVPLPPSPPSIPSECIQDVGVWRRYVVQVPAGEVGLWASTIPTLTLLTGSNAERQVRIRYFPNPNGVAPELVDTSSWQAELILTYIPPQTELVLDGVTQRVWATVNGQGPIPGNQLLYGTNGAPATWPELRCGVGYVITLDVPLDAPAGNLESELVLTPRM